MRRAPALVLTFLIGCDETRAQPPIVGGRDATTTATRADAAPGSQDASLDDSGTASGIAGISFMTRLAGLWGGPGTGTRLGSFPRMVMDFRASDPKTLFGRVDLDANNSLRMAFYVENLAGVDTLIFRNGGLFMGLSRDTRAKLVEVDEARGHFRFCEVDQGCDYNEAIFDFSAPGSLVLDVTVRRAMHLHWTPTRQETRTLPDPFPAAGAVPPGSTFPPMASLIATVRWSPALTAPGDAWVILSTSDCTISSCVVSRHQLAAAPVGATSAQLTLDQIHAGPYKLVGFIDRDRNVGTTFAPDSGDGVTLPNQAVTVGAAGNATWDGTVVIDLP